MKMLKVFILSSLVLGSCAKKSEDNLPTSPKIDAAQAMRTADLATLEISEAMHNVNECPKINGIYTLETLNGIKKDAAMWIDFKYTTEVKEYDKEKPGYRPSEYTLHEEISAPGTDKKEYYALDGYRHYEVELAVCSKQVVFIDKASKDGKIIDRLRFYINTEKKLVKEYLHHESEDGVTEKKIWIFKYKSAIE